MGEVPDQQFTESIDRKCFFLTLNILAALADVQTALGKLGEVLDTLFAENIACEYVGFPF